MPWSFSSFQPVAMWLLARARICLSHPIASCLEGGRRRGEEGRRPPARNFYGSIVWLAVRGGGSWSAQEEKEEGRKKRGIGVSWVSKSPPPPQRNGLDLTELVGCDFVDKRVPSSLSSAHAGRLGRETQSLLLTVLRGWSCLISTGWLDAFLFRLRWESCNV